jgi:hypothetical protein
MSASFTFQASNLTTLSLDQLSSRAKRGDLMFVRKGMGLPLSLLSSQRRIQQPRLVNDQGTLFSVNKFERQIVILYGINQLLTFAV